MPNAGPNIQLVQSREEFIRQHINEAFEQIRKDTANPPIQPRIQLKEGWQNGNIHYDTVAPTNPIPNPTDVNYPHTWDIWLVVDTTPPVTPPDPIPPTYWYPVTEIYVRHPYE